jgi:hypothetical protein
MKHVKLILMIHFINPIYSKYYCTTCNQYLKMMYKLGAMAHACNSNNLGGTYWEDPGLRPAQAKS